MGSQRVGHDRVTKHSMTGTPQILTMTQVPLGVTFFPKFISLSNMVVSTTVGDIGTSLAFKDTSQRFQVLLLFSC